jgi:hypothetical protein
MRPGFVFALASSDQPREVEVCVVRGAETRRRRQPVDGSLETFGLARHRHAHHRAGGLNRPKEAQGL